MSDRGGGRPVIVLGDTGALDLGDVVPGFVLDVDALFQTLYLD